jgi:prevent-host-death family protein
MNTGWQLQEAKNKFSEVVDKAISSGPQEVTRRGKKTAVVLSFEDYKKLKGRKETLVEFFRHSPLRKIDLKRRKDLPRDAPL